MPAKSSSPERRPPPWQNARIHWPVEQIPVRLEIVHPRKLTALEWVLLRVVDEFRDAPPPLREVAEEIGIDDPAFLHDTLVQLIRLRAIEPRGEEPPRDLPDVDFTSTGHELFRRGQVEAEPAEHGLTFFIDHLTDEGRPEPRETTAWPEDPFPSDNADPEAREGVGLDRARALVERFRSNLLKGDGEVRSVRTSGYNSVVWVPTDIDLRIDTDGRVQVESASLSSQAREVLLSHDLVEEGLVTTTLGAEASHPCRGDASVPFADWTARVIRTVPAAAAVEEGLRVVQAAKTELLIHDWWWGFREVRKALAEAVKRGVRVFVVGSDALTLEGWSTARGLGFIVRCPTEGTMPGGLVADDRLGALVEWVAVRVGDREVGVELVGPVRQDEVARLRGQLGDAARACLQALEPGLGESESRDDESPEAAVERWLGLDSTRLALTRLSLRPDRDSWGLVVETAGCTTGLSLLAVLERAGKLASALAPALPSDLIRKPRLTAWRELAGTPDLSSKEFLTLARWAPDGVAAQEFVDEALRRLEPLGDMADRDPAVEALLDLASRADRRWGARSTEGVASWREARDAILSADVSDIEGLDGLLAAARRLLPSQELADWALEVLLRMDPPPGPGNFANWAAMVSKLDDLIPAEAREHRASIWRELFESNPSDERELARAARGHMDAELVADALLPPSAPLRRLIDVVGLLADCGFALEPAAWSTRLRAQLPEPGSSPPASVVDELVPALREASRAHPALDSAAAQWAGEVAEALPKPTSADGLPWWLDELRPLTPLLRSVGSRAGAEVERFGRQLQAARAAGEWAWDETLRAWTGLGLDLADLEAAVDRAVQRGGSKAGSGSKSKKKNKRRRKR